MSEAAHIVEHVRRRLKFSGALACVLLCTLARADGPRFTGEQLRVDLAYLARALHEMPADLAHSADVPRLERAIRDLDTSLANSPPLDRDAAWRLLATLNPLLADGHLFVGFLDWRGETRAHLAAGGLLFPFEMQVTPDCNLRVRAALGGGDSPVTNAFVRRVDRISARTVCEQLLARAHGDTRNFRADLVSRRFWFYYWKVFGAPDAYQIELAGEQDARRIPGSAQVPRLLADESDFNRQFQLSFPANAPVAVLKLGTFAWPDKQRLFDFTRASFAQIHGRHVNELIIDLRDNGGGDDESWVEGVMPYIAGKPFRIGSHYRKRVVVADPARHEVPGSVVDGEIDDWFPPRAHEPLRFTGRVYVVVGAGTYSSAVVMSNVIQDFGFGLVAGRGDSVRTQQSGGARRTTLPNSGLILVTPRFVLTRPSAAAEPALLTPDVYLDESQPAEAIAGFGAR
ncbi:MAG TPA: S41 family peptidase [Steroidobacteraceae bacterium]|nr:S41 family peptidase [Steroidobacteraceae bacterium]